MKALNRKRARLRDELQQAYNAWISVGEAQAKQATPADRLCVDISGSSDGAKQQWRDYLAAKERLILAYAEQPLTA